MRQILQNLRTGSTEVVSVPAASASRGHILIGTSRTLVSPGTERMLVEFGRANLLSKAKAQPDKVRQVIEKIRTDGLLPALDSVFARLGEPLRLGYCNAGRVVEVGPGVTDFWAGDRVVSNGPHAEIVGVPQNLCARIPDGVTDDAAAFTILGAVALQGIRLVGPSLGETIVVTGLGLVGLITVQILLANGCRVLGLDFDSNRVKLAESFGAAGCDLSKGGDPVSSGTALSQGKGVDAVLITASTKSSDPVHQAAQMCRKRGRIVLVGVSGLELSRADFYEKELTFQVSCSYGPGRYDKNYEEKGHDYPYGFVRWTEQRNFEAVLELLRTRKLIVDDLITHRIPFAEAARAYDTILTDPAALGVILEYQEQVPPDRTIMLESEPVRPVPGTKEVQVGLIGAGNFARVTLRPALTKAKARVRWVADLNGVLSRDLASKVGANSATTDYRFLATDPETGLVIIAAGHNVHAQMVCEFLEAGKHVLVEKPLALTLDELERVVSVAQSHPAQILGVGFNRRFSPHSQAVKEALRGRLEPLAMSYLANAGAVPADHWVHDPVAGGGRIVGEACHFIDLMVFLSGSLVDSVSAVQMGDGPSIREDKMSIVLSFQDGSIGSVNYFANGSRAFPKEVVTVFSEGRTARIENFRKTKGFGFKRFRTLSTFRQDKGHASEVAAFLKRAQNGGQQLLSLAEMVNVTLASFAAVTSAREHRALRLAEEYPSFFAS
jgi:predicted dehydrogenase/threonine dehydrogenase-like Zn-dependent dehydrogenase